MRFINLLLKLSTALQYCRAKLRIVCQDFEETIQIIVHVVQFWFTEMVRFIINQGMDRTLAR